MRLSNERKTILNKITLTINNKQVTVKKQMTILQAAQSIGIEIPNLCYMKRQPPNSTCRLCVVEVEGAQTLIPSCSFPVSDGLVIHTNSEQVQKARKIILELLLSAFFLAVYDSICIVV